MRSVSPLFGHHGALVLADRDLLGPAGDLERGRVVVGEAGALVVVLDPEVGRLGRGLEARHRHLEVGAVAELVEERVEVAVDEADLGHLAAGQRVAAHPLDDGVGVRVEAKAAQVAEGDLRGRGGEGAEPLELDEHVLRRPLRPARLVGRAALDAALGVGDHRLRRPVALGDGDRERLVGEAGGEAGIAHDLGPGAEVALLDGGVAVLDRRADLDRGEDARPLGGRLLDGGEREGERLVGGGHLHHRDLELDPGPELGRRGDAAELEDLRPEVGVLEVALGDAADGVAGLEDHALERPLNRGGKRGRRQRSDQQQPRHRRSPVATVSSHHAESGPPGKIHEFL